MPAPSASGRSAAAIRAEVSATLATLKRRGSAKRRREMLPRYGIIAPKSFGVAMTDLKRIAAQLGQSHELAAALWDTGWYEARLLASFVDEPVRVTPAQMDRWCRDFDNWGICDTICFHLFDRTPHAFARVKAWAARRPEYERRAAFALLASLALHRKEETDAPFVRCLPLIARAATDERNFVKKGVSWALRSVGRRSPPLYAASIALAERLASSDLPVSRWIGSDALRDLRKPALARRLAAT